MADQNAPGRCFVIFFCVVFSIFFLHNFHKTSTSLGIAMGIIENSIFSVEFEKTFTLSSCPFIECKLFVENGIMNGTMECKSDTYDLYPFSVFSLNNSFRQKTPILWHAISTNGGKGMSITYMEPTHAYGYNPVFAKCIYDSLISCRMF